MLPCFGFSFRFAGDASIVFLLMIRRPPRSTQSRSSAASDVYKRQIGDVRGSGELGPRPNQIGGAVGAAIVDHEHIDAGRQLPVGRGAQVTDQLVQRRPEPGLFVVRGQNDAQAPEDHDRECIGALVTSYRRPTGPRPIREPRPWARPPRRRSANRSFVPVEWDPADATLHRPCGFRWPFTGLPWSFGRCCSPSILTPPIRIPTTTSTWRGRYRSATST